MNRSFPSTSFTPITAAPNPENAATFSMKAESMGGALDGAIARSQIADLDSALQAIGEAEKLIHVQRKRIAYLETLALADEVTGLTNRRGFMAALQRELSMARRDQTACHRHGPLP